ncbi:MAG TPA: hypothetical protein VIX91_16435 [Candidatus Acidoferrum sp.]
MVVPTATVIHFICRAEPPGDQRLGFFRRPDWRRICRCFLAAVVRAVIASDSNVGGNVVSQNGSWSSIVRGLGLIGSLDDIRNIVVASHNGTPVYVKDLGTVRIGTRRFCVDYRNTLHCHV